MRYYLKIDTKGNPISQEGLINELLEQYLPVKKIHTTASSVFLQTNRYETNDTSVVGANWDKPYFENDTYFLFIGGHVLNRLSVSDQTNKHTPTPEEIFLIIEKYGDEHFEYLKGSYYILLFDKRNGKISIYSSPLYLYPVFFSIKEGIVIFSDILEFVLKERGSVELFNQGLVEFSLFDHPIGVNTIYKDVYLVPGGTRIDIANGTFKEKVVYDIAKWIHKDPISRKDSLDKLDNILNKVIDNYTSKVKRFNISLTGGFDGRLNFSIIDSSDYSRLQAFSYGKKGSLQLSIPQEISQKLDFSYTPVNLDQEFVDQYGKLGYDTILLSGGITPYTRANYLYAYAKINSFSRNCILGQCDMIRPLYTNPAGAIFNNFAHSIFYKNSFSDFYKDFQHLAVNGYLNADFFTKEVAENIYENIQKRYIIDYSKYNPDERYFLYLYKESMLKFWHTECHVVDLLVDDFISFSDLDFIEYLSSTAYFGLYKGIFASNQFRRRKAHDLYIDLMTINNNKLNNIIIDRLFKPKWLKYGYLGLMVAVIAKGKAIKRQKRLGNDTFGGMDWSSKFFQSFPQILEESSIFTLKNINPYSDNNSHRYDRHVSLKLWLDYMGIKDAPK